MLVIINPALMRICWVDLPRTYSRARSVPGQVGARVDYRRYKADQSVALKVPTQPRLPYRGPEVSLRIAALG